MLSELAPGFIRPGSLGSGHRLALAPEYAFLGKMELLIIVVETHTGANKVKRHAVARVQPGMIFQPQGLVGR